VKKLVLDLDNTLAFTDKQCKGKYQDAIPCYKAIEKVRAYKKLGFIIIIFTSRNMQTYKGSIGHINAHTIPVIVEWLNKHDIPFDEIHIGKPWCGTKGFYVDDKAVRPSEFVNLSYKEIKKLIVQED
jgi:capsule biosynthesis phosphatase